MVDFEPFRCRSSSTTGNSTNCISWLDQGSPVFFYGFFIRNNYDKSNDDSGGMLEDGRIGRQLRLLSRELDEDNVLKICQQLQVSSFIDS